MKKNKLYWIAKKKLEFIIIKKKKQVSNCPYYTKKEQKRINQVLTEIWDEVYEV